MSQVLLSVQRRVRVYEYLQVHKIVHSTTLGTILDVSGAMIRRGLECQGAPERIHGGAIFSQRMRYEQ